MPDNDSTFAISTKALSKRYRLHTDQKQRLSDLFAFGSHRRSHDFWAVKDVCLDVVRGTTLGIVGRNGSGKSTLLKLVCGTIFPTSGEIHVKGRVSSLLELGVGFNPELTGRQNIALQGAILGYSKKEMEERAPMIEEFAEIGEHIDQPVKHYSSGMSVRLGFACAINVSPEILVVDEALAVGDIKFQRKCYARIEEFRRNNVTILLVSHSLEVIRMYCDEAVLMDYGSIVERGDPKVVTDAYHKLMFGNMSSEVDVKANSVTPVVAPADAPGVHRTRLNGAEIERLKKVARERLQTDDRMALQGETRLGNGLAEIMDFGIVDLKGNPSDLLETGELYVFYFRILFRSSLGDVRVALNIKNLIGLRLFWTANPSYELVIPDQKKGDVLECRVRVKMNLVSGDYFVGLNVDSKDGITIYDRRIDVMHFKVSPRKELENCVVDLEAHMEVEQLLSTE